MGEKYLLNLTLKEWDLFSKELLILSTSYHEYLKKKNELNSVFYPKVSKEKN